jgi:hypothetical protein
VLAISRQVTGSHDRRQARAATLPDQGPQAEAGGSCARGLSQCTPLASLITQAQQLLPQAVHDTRDQELTWAQIGELLGTTAATAARRHRTIHDQLDNDHPHNADVSVLRLRMLMSKQASPSARERFRRS